jgi:hypothetical protein
MLAVRRVIYGLAWGGEIGELCAWMVRCGGGFGSGGDLDTFMTS